MQKVVGSSPIIRFLESPGIRAFFLTDQNEESAICNHDCNQATRMRSCLPGSEAADAGLIATGGDKMKLTAYTVQAWPKAKYKRYRARQGCMRNARRLALDHPDKLILVKGYARAAAGEWLGHWWCSDLKGRVVDPSWKNEGLAYVGVEVVDVTESSRKICSEGYIDLGLPGFAPPELLPQLEFRVATGTETGA
jgi:hypothetical protein